MSCQPLDRCLACGGDHLTRYLDLGSQPLANSFHDGSAELPRYPLGLQVCIECWHSQNLVAVDPDLMFKDYPYVSGTTETLREYFRDFVSRVERDFLNAEVDNEWNGELPRLRVLDIGSNDGSLLGEFTALGHKGCGVDPAENLAESTAGNAVPTWVGYWNDEAVEAVMATDGPFDVIVAMNVLAHTADPLGFLKLAKDVLAPGGRIYVQTSQARMIENGEFDTVYHEHHSFFTVSSFCALATRAGLCIESIEHVPIHGTSYLVVLSHPGPWQPPRYETFLLGLAEKEMGYYAFGLYGAMQEKADLAADWVRNTIRVARENGFRAVGYGAAAKGMTFLNFAGIDLEFIVDDNPLKQGKLTPGRNIPVHGSNELAPDFPGRDGTPILFLILAWNFAAEIRERIFAVRKQPSDRFLTYFPSVKLS